MSEPPAAIETDPPDPARVPAGETATDPAEPAAATVPTADKSAAEAVPVADNSASEATPAPDDPAAEAVPVADDPAAEAVSVADDPAAAGTVAPELAASDVDTAGTGELDALTAVLDSDDGHEPRRHWLRYPGVIGAFAVIAVVLLVPCGAGVLFLTGGFADHGRYAVVPDACRHLGPQRVRAEFGPGLVRYAHSNHGDSSSCLYEGGAATGPAARIRLSLTRYGTKGPVSAPRMAHGGFRTGVNGLTGPHRPLPGLGDEAEQVRTGTGGIVVYARTSNLVLELDITGDDAGMPARAVTAATHIAAELP